MPYAYLDYFEARSDETQSYLFNPYTGETLLGYISLDQLNSPSSRAFSARYPPEYPLPEDLDLGTPKRDLQLLRSWKTEYGENEAITRAVVKLQSWARGCSDRKLAADKVRVTFIKNYDSSAYCYYYTNLVTGWVPYGSTVSYDSLLNFENGLAPIEQYGVRKYSSEGAAQWHRPVALGRGAADLPCQDDGDGPSGGWGAGEGQAYLEGGAEDAAMALAESKEQALVVPPAGGAEGKEGEEEGGGQQPRRRQRGQPMTMADLRGKYPWCHGWQREGGFEDRKAPGAAAAEDRYVISQGPFARRAGRGKTVDCKVTDPFLEPERQYAQEPYRGLQNTEYAEAKLGQEIIYYDKGSEKSCIVDPVFLFRVADAKGTRAVCDIMDRYATSVPVQLRGFETLAKKDYGEDDEGNISDPARFAVDMCFQRMKAYPSTAQIQGHALCTLCQLADNYAVRRYIKEEYSEWLDLVKSALTTLKMIKTTKMEQDPDTDELYQVTSEEPSEASYKVTEYSCKFISAMAYEDKQRLELAETAVEPILEAMKFSKDHVMTQMNACMAFYNFCYRDEEAQHALTATTGPWMAVDRILNSLQFEGDHELLRAAGKARAALGEDGYRGTGDQEAFELMMNKVAVDNAARPQLPQVHYEKTW